MQLHQQTTAIEKLNRRPEKALISLLHSQTIDLYAQQLSPALKQQLQPLRQRALDGTKITVEQISAEAEGYRIILDENNAETLWISHADSGDYQQTLGGGLCNLSRDLMRLLPVFTNGRGQPLPELKFLTWSDAAEHIPGQAIAGQSRTSLIFQAPDFPKLILCEQGPCPAPDTHPWQQEQLFYGDSEHYIFIGQEPLGSAKFEWLRNQKLKHQNLKVFWLVGSNQLRNLYTDYRNIFAVVDVISLNLAEAAQFFGFEPLQNRHKNADELRKMYAREISRRILKYGCSFVVITDGAKGASLARQARGGKVELVYSPLIQENSLEVDAQVREDTGCGDSFAAAIAAYFLHCPVNFKLQEATQFAHYIAGIIYQRPRPYLTTEDDPFIQEARAKAQQSSALVGNREVFNRNQCQIQLARMMLRGPRQNVLVLLLGGNPADPTQPDITGVDAALEELAQRCRNQSYAFAPLIHIVPRLTNHPQTKNKLTIRTLTPDLWQQYRQQGAFCKELGQFDTLPLANGVLKEDLQQHHGVYLLRTTLLETLEIMASEDFAEWFSDIKCWHFATEKVDERLVWHAKKWGVSKAQSQEIIRQELRDYILNALGPQYRFSRVNASNLADFNQEMTEQLILRVNALLSGIFRNSA